MQEKCFQVFIIGMHHTGTSIVSNITMSMGIHGGIDRNDFFAEKGMLLFKEKIEHIMHAHKNHFDGFQVLDLDCPPYAENEIDNDDDYMDEAEKITKKI